MHLTSTAAVRNTHHSQAEALQTAERLRDCMFFTCEYVSKNGRNWIWTFFLCGTLALHYSSEAIYACVLIMKLAYEHLNGFYCSSAKGLAMAAVVAPCKSLYNAEKRPDAHIS